MQTGDEKVLPSLVLAVMVMDSTSEMVPDRS